MSDKIIFQVSEFNEFVNSYLSQMGEIIIEGEISDIRINQGKWLFATIKDKASSLDIFSVAFKISGYELLEPGMLVRVYGKPTVYAKTGRFSIFAEHIVPAGEGALRLAFEKLKAKLEKEGLFEIERKRSLPIFPENIGLITAKGSKAYSDFIKVLKERMGGIKIYFYPVNVQGQDSVNSIVNAFDFFNKNKLNIDLLVLTRGGGSLEDLQSFNDEKVASAIFSSKIPVVSAIGHEEDISIADFVADLRASTPSNAAELIVKNRQDLINETNFKIKTIESNLKQLLQHNNQRMLRNVHILSNAITQQLSYFYRIIERFSANFSYFIKKTISFSQNSRDTERQLIKAVDFWLKQKNTSLDSLTRLLESLDFHKVLERGYSITLTKKGSIVKSINDLTKGDTILTTLFDGKITSEISGTE